MMDREIDAKIELTIQSNTISEHITADMIADALNDAGLKVETNECGMYAENTICYRVKEAAVYSRFTVRGLAQYLRNVADCIEEKANGKRTDEIKDQDHH